MEEQDEGGLENVRNIQLMIILNNQEIKANEQYIFHKKVEIEKLDTKCDEQKQEIAALEKKYISLTSARIQSENSLSISNECLKTMSDHIIIMHQEKEKEEELLESFKNKYADVIKEFNEEYEKMRKEYEENTPGYKKLKELEEKNTQLKAEINVLENNIATEKNIRKESTEVKKREFYNAIVQFAETVLSYKKNKETFMLCKQLEKEEIELLKKYSELEKQNLFRRRSSFVIPKVPPPFQMSHFRSLPFSRALSNTVPMSPRKYSLLQNEKSTHKEIIEDMKRRKLNPLTEQNQNKDLNGSQKSVGQFDTSPYFQNLPGSTSQNVQNEEHDSIKTFNKNREKIKVIDVAVIPASPATFKNTISNKTQNTNNNTFIQKSNLPPLPYEGGQFRDPKIKFDPNNSSQPKTTFLNKYAINSHSLEIAQNKNIFRYQKSITATDDEPINTQDLLFSQDSVTNQFKDSQTGLTPEMLRFKIPPEKTNQINSEENRENDEVQGDDSNDQGTEGQPFNYNKGNCTNKSLNNSFNIESSFRYENANNNSFIFGQFNKPNEIPYFQPGDVSNQPNVSGIGMQHYMDTENENYVCSPINSFLLNTSNGKEDKDENKNKQANDFFFKFGESTSNNGPSGQKKLFDMFY